MNEFHAPVQKVLWLKFLEPGGVPPIAVENGSKFRWSLPRNGRPGQWARRIYDPSLCRAGYHLTDPAHAFIWARKQLYVAEVSVDPHKDDRSQYEIDTNHWSKVTFSRARLLRRVKRWNRLAARRIMLKIAIRATQIAPNTPPRQRQKLLRVLRLLAREYTTQNLASLNDIRTFENMDQGLERLLEKLYQHRSEEFKALRAMSEYFYTIYENSKPVGMSTRQAGRWLASLLARETGLKGRSLWG